MNEETILRQAVGIDISKDDFKASYGVLTGQLAVKLISSRSFKNTPYGFEQFFQWVVSRQSPDVDVALVMEATGVYYESLAYFLHERNLHVHVVLPNQAKKYGGSLGVKSKTDQIDAGILARLGLERNLSLWSPLSPHFRSLRQLCRERDAYIHTRTVLKNQLHAYTHQGVPPESSIDRCKGTIHFVNEQIFQIGKEIKQIVQGDVALKERLAYVLSIKGVGFWTAVTVVAETNGFAIIHNIKQLVSYAGLDIKLAESGKWKGKSRISKQGNKYIRKSLYFPALSKSMHDPQTKEYYRRLKERKGVGMVAAVAVQRKLLGLMYTLWKKQEMFNPQQAVA